MRASSVKPLDGAKNRRKAVRAKEESSKVRKLGAGALRVRTEYNEIKRNSTENVFLEIFLVFGGKNFHLLS